MTRSIAHDKNSAVSLLFAAAAIPLVISVGLAVDYSFYIQAQAELNLAADTAAMEAVRVASANFLAGQDANTAGVSGQTAGQQWFAAQLGSLRTGTVGSIVIPQVTYDSGTSTFTSNVTYAGTVPTHFGGIVNVLHWPVHGVSSAVISTNSYAEVLMLIDNSSSMLIGATPADIVNLENATICPPTATANAAQQSMVAYSWNFNPNSSITINGWGYYKPVATGNLVLPQIVPTPLTTVGACDPNFIGGAAQCPYPPSLPAVNKSGFCPTGTGIPDPGYSDKYNNILPRTDPNTLKIANIPQAPCGFACHTGDGVNDYYNIARKAGVTLRFDVIQQAAAEVVQQMQSQQQIPNQFSLGVFEFKDNVTQVHPAPGGPFVEADNNLSGGQTDISNIATPIVPDQANTNFPGAAQYLAANLKPAGSGNTPTTPRKNIFIVTDGLEDYSPANRYIGQIENPLTDQYCAPLKTLGFNVYVLYTPYYPLPNYFYLNSGPRSYVEPTVPPATTNPAVDALKACATTPQQFYQASSAADIKAAMLAMLASALNSPARLAM